MRRDITIAADLRTSRGKNEARRTRREGKVPAVVYGAFQDAVAVAVNPREVTKLLRTTGYNTIFNLAIAGGETVPVMVVDEQVDPIRSSLLHVDFKRVDLTKRLHVSIPVATQGEAKGIKLQGGLLEVITRSVEIECLPDEIPERFVVDVTELMIGQAKRASDLDLSGSVKLVSPGDQVIAHVVALRAEAVETPAEGAAPVEGAVPAAGEPEVIKKGKKEEEAEEKGKKK